MFKNVYLCFIILKLYKPFGKKSANKPVFLRFCFLSTKEPGAFISMKLVCFVKGVYNLACDICK